MDATVIAAGVCTAVGLATVGAGALAGRADRRDDPARYLVDLDADGRPAEGTGDPFQQHLEQPFHERVLRPVVDRVGGWIAVVTPRDHRTRVRTSLAAAGLDLRRRPEDVIAAQAVGAALGLAAGLALVATGTLSPLLGLGVLALLVFLGVMGPMAWLRNKVDERRDAIRRDLPDMLDLLAISVEAGVGLEGAMEVVSSRLESPLAGELARCLREMELGLRRRDALANLRQRTAVPELSSFVHALIQADALGMPLGRVLKTQATEMRAKRRQWARERAAKLPVKILLPLVFCIFPAVLVVILGPAVSQIGDAF